MVKTLDTSAEETRAERKSFTNAEKAKAVKLVNKQGYTQKLAAAEIGCSVPSLINWLKKAKKAKTKKKFNAVDKEGKEEVRATRKTKKAKRVRRMKKAARKSVKQAAKVSFGEFVHEYWDEHPGETVSKQSIKDIHGVLKYAYDKLG